LKDEHVSPSCRSEREERGELEREARRIQSTRTRVDSSIQSVGGIKIET
jgi:hypothetical protein